MNSGTERDKINELLNSHPFQFAKTMPTIPHEYTLRKHWNDQEFEQVVLFMREHGKEEKFYRKTFTYWYANGYKYWTMGAPVEKTILINRAIAP